MVLSRLQSVTGDEENSLSSQRQSNVSSSSASSGTLCLSSVLWTGIFVCLELMQPLYILPWLLWGHMCSCPVLSGSTVPLVYGIPLALIPPSPSSFIKIPKTLSRQDGSAGKNKSKKKMHAFKPEELSLIPRPHIVEGQKELPQVCFPFYACIMSCPCPFTWIQIHILIYK